MKKGIINVGIVVTSGLAVIGSLITLVYSNLTQRIMEVEARSNMYAADISTIKIDVGSLRTDMNWVKSALENKGFQPKVEKITSSTTLK